MEKTRHLEKLHLPQGASADEIKHAYRRLALKYHPDKNPDPDAAATFAEIHEAYEYLMEETTTEAYNDILSDYLQHTFGSDILYKTLLKVVLKKLVTSKAAIDWLRRLNVGMLEKIHAYLTQNSEVFHLPEEFLDGLGSVIREKTPKSNNTYVLNPTIDDMFACNLYRLTVDGTDYAVPLWHHEMVFEDPSGLPIYVECQPILSSEIYVDSYNTTHVYLSKQLDDVWKEGGVQFTLGKQEFFVSRDRMTLSDNQTTVLRKQGIPLINTANPMDVSRRGDVHVHIILSI